MIQNVCNEGSQHTRGGRREGSISNCVVFRAKGLLSEAQLRHKITNTKAISCFKRKCARYQEAFKHSKSTGAEQCKRNRSAIYHAYFDSVKNIRHRGLWNSYASRCEQEHWQKMIMKTAGSRARQEESSSPPEPPFFSSSCAAPAGSECDTDSLCRWDIRCLRRSCCCTEADLRACPGERQPSCHPRWWICPWTDLKAQFQSSAFGKCFRNEPNVRSQINVSQNAFATHFSGETV